jgi:hypothetical protein
MKGRSTLQGFRRGPRCGIDHLFQAEPAVCRFGALRKTERRNRCEFAVLSSSRFCARQEVSLKRHVAVWSNAAKAWYDSPAYQPFVLTGLKGRFIAADRPGRITPVRACS